MLIFIKSIDLCHYVKCSACHSAYQRLGLDVQADIGGVRLMAAWMTTEDDNASGSVDNDAWSLHGQYTLKDKGRHVALALLRLDEFEKNDGKDSFSTIYFCSDVQPVIPLSRYSPV